FSSLGLDQIARSTGEFLRRARAVRLASAAAIGALVILFFSTGTNPPGNFLFDILYRLPLGWLLREPGRFLMVASLAYAVLGAVVVEAAFRHGSVLGLRALSGIRSAPVVRGLTLFVALASVVSLGFPEYTGMVASDNR